MLRLQGYGEDDPDLSRWQILAQTIAGKAAGVWVLPGMFLGEISRRFGKTHELTGDSPLRNGRALPLAIGSYFAAPLEQPELGLLRPAPPQCGHPVYEFGQL